MNAIILTLLSGIGFLVLLILEKCMSFKIDEALIWRKEGNNILILSKTKNLLIFGKEICDLFDDAGNFIGERGIELDFLIKKGVLNEYA
jgi:hypothetical protein